MSGLNLDKPIYISTIIDSFNYGTVLQALATNNILRKYGSPYFVDYKRPQWTTRGWLATTIFDQNYNPLLNLLRVITQAPNRLYGERLFHHTIKNYLSLISAESFLGKRPFSLDEDAIYCVGSDQTWNFEYNHGIDPVYFLKYVPDKCFKFSFASSFGRASLSKREREETYEALKRFSSLSVREKSSVGILNDIGLSAIALCDPVLLCDQRYWNKLANIKNSPLNEIKKNYILIYQLNQRSDIVNHALELQRKEDLEVIIIGLDWKLPAPKGTKRILYPSIETWLKLFSQASLVLTDSFHGTCFSLIFKRPFISFAPPKYSIRISDLLSELALASSNYINSYPSDSVRIQNFTPAITNWSKVDEYLNDKKLQAENFLNSIFERY